MYLRSQFRETRLDVLHGLVRAHPLATFITTSESRIDVNHMPLLLTKGPEGSGVLSGHIPRSNPVWRALDGKNEAVAVFQGPECYVTPSWYASKREHGKVVPTWNYAVVHARGRPRVLDDRDWLRAHLNALTDEQEARLAVPWKVSDAPEHFVARMIETLVGVEMPIESIVGKWKVSQNRPVRDRLGVAAGLRSRGDEAALAMEALVMQQANEPDENA